MTAAGSTGSGALLFPEDLHPGRRFGLGEHTLTARDIVEFGRLWDPMPFHLGEAEAAATPIGELIASGIQTMAVFQLLCVSGLYRRLPVIAGRGVREMRLLKPVRPQTALAGSAQIDDVQLRDDGRAVLLLRGWLHDHHGDTVMETVTESLLARRAQ